MFERIPNIEGRLLPARILEADPRKALQRGVVMILRWLRRSPGITPSRLMGRFSHAALVVAGAVPMTNLSEEKLNPYLPDYSVFCRATSSLWHLRLAHSDYRELAEKLLGTEDEAAFAHDEFVLFIATQLRASGVAVQPTPADGGKRPDLHVPNALVDGGPLYWECKERNPTASRDPNQLIIHFRRALCTGSLQIKDRGKASRGLVSIDMGIIQSGQAPPQHQIVEVLEEVMKTNEGLIGVSISATILCVETGTGLNYFQPLFHSQLRLQDRCPLRPEVRAGILYAMPHIF